MKYINKYDNKVAYDADGNRPTTEATVSKIWEVIKFDKGYNLVAEKQFCAVGDTVIYDKTDKLIKVVKLGTFNPATLDARYVIAGTVYNRTNSEMWVVSNASQGNVMWADGIYQTQASGLVQVYGSITMNNGIGTVFAGCNLEKSIAFSSVSGTDDVNVTIPTTTRIKESKFNITDNPLLVAYYKTYREYMKSIMLKYPYSKGAIIDKNGKENTQILGSVLFTDGAVEKPAYPAAHTALNFGIVTTGEITGFEIGNWWLPSAHETNLLIKDSTVGIEGIPTDDMNRGISDAGGSTLSAITAYWTSTERASTLSWYYTGNTGNISGNYKTNSYQVRPITSIKL